MHRLTPLLTAALTLVLWGARLPVQAQTAASMEPAPTATPVFSTSPEQSFPRLSGLANAAIQAQVNKQLANRERNDRAARADCLRQYPAHGKPSYSELVRMAYLSPRLLSVDVRVTSLCGSAPAVSNQPYPITFDLTTGRELDWHGLFTAEFLTPPADKASPLLTLYLRYARLDEECTTAINDPGTAFSLWLESARRVLLARPSSLAQESAACAKIAAIPFAEIAPYLQTPLLRQELVPPAAATEADSRQR